MLRQATQGMRDRLIDVWCTRAVPRVGSPMATGGSEACLLIVLQGMPETVDVSNTFQWATHDLDQWSKHMTPFSSQAIP